MKAGVYKLKDLKGGKDYYNWGFEDGRMASGLWTTPEGARTTGSTWSKGRTLKEEETLYSESRYELFESAEPAKLATPTKDGYYSFRTDWESLKGTLWFGNARSGKLYGGWVSLEKAKKNKKHPSVFDRNVIEWTFLEPFEPEAQEYVVGAIYRLNNGQFAFWRPDLRWSFYQYTVSDLKRNYSNLSDGCWHPAESFTGVEFMENRGDTRTASPPKDKVPHEHGIYKVKISDKEDHRYSHWNGSAWSAICHRLKELKEELANHGHTPTSYQIVSWEFEEHHDLPSSKIAHPTQAGLYKVWPLGYSKSYFSWWDGEHFCTWVEHPDLAYSRRAQFKHRLDKHEKWEFVPPAKLNTIPKNKAEPGRPASPRPTAGAALPQLVTDRRKLLLL